jgi:tRNA(Arg) A34 adenosine deaminase TadA
MGVEPTPFPPGHPDARWMKEAIRVARVSQERGDYAFGAVLVRDDKIVTASGNKVITYRDPTGHAELNCLRKAALREGHRHLRPGAVLYCTHAPCPMCLAMCVWAKVSGVVYGCYQSDIGEWGRTHSGAVFTWRSVKIEPDELYQSLREAHPTMAILGGFQREECLTLFHD